MYTLRVVLLEFIFQLKCFVILTFIYEVINWYYYFQAKKIINIVWCRILLGTFLIENSFLLIKSFSSMKKIEFLSLPIVSLFVLTLKYFYVHTFNVANSVKSWSHSFIASGMSSGRVKTFFQGDGTSIFFGYCTLWRGLSATQVCFTASLCFL